MKKDVIKSNVYYTLVWSPVFQYDKHSLARILPETSGISALITKKDEREEYLMFYAGWRDGLRTSMRKLLDPNWALSPKQTYDFDLENLYFKYTTIETSIHDLRDIFYWLILTYTPPYNDPTAFTDSGRYESINIKEQVLKKGEVLERFYTRVK